VARAPSSTVASTWFAGWHADAGDFPPEDLSWEKYTTVTYAFALTNPDPADLTMSSQDDSILRRVVQLGHAAVRQFCFVLLLISRIYVIRRFLHSGNKDNGGRWRLDRVPVLQHGSREPSKSYQIHQRNCEPRQYLQLGWCEFRVSTHANLTERFCILKMTCVAGSTLPNKVLGVIS